MAVSSPGTELAVPLTAPAKRWRGEAYAAFAALAWSSAGILQRRLRVSVPTQLGARAALFAFLALGCFVVLSEHRPRQLFVRLRVLRWPREWVSRYVWPQPREPSWWR